MGYLTPGSVLLVTGASGSIGFEVAIEAARDGAIVAIHGSRAESVAGAIQRLRDIVPDARLLAAPADFTETGAIERMVVRVVQEAGRLDAVIHCGITAAEGITGPFAATDPTAFGRLAGNVVGAFQELCWHAVPHLAVNGGTIVAFASDSGRFAAPRQAMMGAAFGAIMVFVRNLATEVSRQKVRVHCISPSYVAETQVFERFSHVTGRGDSASRRAGLGLPTPRDIVPMALFLCSEGAKRITGQVISINGGLNA